MSRPIKKMPALKFENELLANERTFLAWLRTSIAVMSLGFVIARFGLWLRELAVQINPHVVLRHTGLSLPLGRNYDRIRWAANLNRCVALPCCEPRNRARRNQIRSPLGVSRHGRGSRF